jgi:hypothetical protein
VVDDGGARARMAGVLSQRGNQLVMTKRVVKVAGPYDLVTVKLPFPLPVSWGMTIKPYRPKNIPAPAVPDTVYVEQPDILSADLPRLGKYPNQTHVVLTATRP